jgi:hypothetical protein
MEQVPDSQDRQQPLEAVGNQGESRGFLPRGSQNVRGADIAAPDTAHIDVRKDPAEQESKGHCADQIGEDDGEYLKECIHALSFI